VSLSSFGASNLLSAICLQSNGYILWFRFSRYSQNSLPVSDAASNLRIPVVVVVCGRVKSGHANLPKHIDFLINLN